MIVQASLKVLPTNFESRIDNYKLVDEALILIKKSNIKHQIGPSQTTLEGEFEDIIKLVRQIQNYYYDKHVKSFSVNVSFEYNDDNFYIDDKMKNVGSLEI